MAAVSDKYQYIVNISRDFITLINREYVYEIVNDSYCRTVERSKEEILGKSVAEVWGSERFENAIRKHLDACFEGREVQYIDQFKFGPFEKHMHVCCYPYVDCEGRITHALVFSHDITHISQIESKLTHYEYRDPLTGLFNRRSLSIILAKEIEGARRSADKLRAVLFVELRNLGTVNQVYGYSIGDILLENSGLRIQKALRNSDFVFRFEGNELTCILSHIARETDVAVVAQKIVDQVSMPYHHKDGDIRIGCVAGAAVYPSDGQDPEELIRNAAAAKQEAQRREMAFLLFNPKLHQKAVEKMNLRSDMDRAFGANQFMLVYQPIVDGGGKPKGFEALIRWNHPEKGLIPPGQFIPVAEESGVIHTIGRWAMFAATQQLKEWSRKYGIYVSINLSARDFCDDELGDVLQGALRRSGNISPGFLKLEVTESQCMSDPEKSIQRMRRLVEQGFDLFIDDFGMGTSSLGYLKRLPAQTIKIDRVFVEESVRSPEDFSYVCNIVELARSRHKAVILEGIETAEQCELLRRTEVDGMQGYHFARPMPGEDADALLESGDFLPRVAK